MVGTVISDFTYEKDSFYKTLTPEENAIAHADEYDFDSPLAIDFDVLVKLLRDLKKGYIYIITRWFSIESHNIMSNVLIVSKLKYPFIRSRNINANLKRPPCIPREF